MVAQATIAQLVATIITCVFEQGLQSTARSHPRTFPFLQQRGAREGALHDSGVRTRHTNHLEAIGGRLY
jgi:hypothetical protein